MRNPYLLALCSLLIVINLMPAQGQEPKKKTAKEKITGTWIAVPFSGEPRGGNFSGVDGENIAWQDTDSKETIDLGWNKIEELRRNLLPARDPNTDAGLGAYVLLPEGDSLRGESVAIIENKGLAVQSISIGVMNIPLEQWVGSLLEVPDNLNDVLGLVQKIRTGSDKAGDLILLTNRDQLQGTVLGLDGDNLVIQALGAAKETPINRAGVQAISIDPKSVRYKPYSGHSWSVYLVDGSRISAMSMSQESVDGESVLAITTRWGASWNIPMSKIARILSIPSGQTFLEDRKPDAVQSVDYIGTTPPPRMGRNVKGGPLQIGPRTFDRGIGTQARTLMAYRLTGNETRLSGWVGVDRSAGPLGQAQGIILVDGKPVFDSGPLKAGDPPKRIEIDLKNAKLLILSSEFGEGGGVCDWVNWCEMRIQAKPAN